ncbi:hypothetical protein ACIPSA_17385 [Streptomyces sp. NPDC086549]|uniref:VMAP-C domain-containing protein n=1 Tax=Streptomyces sp. NPDC086549 TaxID=3365752 RepID=UPI0037F571B6
MFRRFLPTGGGRPAHRVTAHASRKTDRLLAAILFGIPRHQELQGRLQLLYEVGPPLEGAVRQDTLALDHLRAIVRAARRVGKLPELRDAAAGLEPDGDIGVVWFDLAVTVLTSPLQPLPAEDLFALIEELHDREPEFGQGAIYAYVSERRRDGRPLDGGLLPQLLSQLCDARARSTDLAARRAELLRFLEVLHAEHTAHGGDDRLSRLLARVLDRHRVTPGRGRWAGTAAQPAGLAGIAGPAQPEGPAGPADAERRVIIQIRVEEPDALIQQPDVPYTRRRYLLRGFHYEGVGDDPPTFHGGTAATDLFTGDELERRGREFLLAWKGQAEAGKGASKRYEFLLPDSLLGFPAELWPGGVSGVPLSHSCQVVVRSLTRYQDSTIHESWARRWDALDRGCPPGDALAHIGWMSPEKALDTDSPSTPWSCPSGTYPPLYLTDPADLQEWLQSHADLTCLGLGAPYTLHDELMRDTVRDALMYDGIPVMVWRRDAGDPALLLDALREPRPPALLAELPHSVLEARRRRRHDPAGVGRQITLLWDDPTCVFSQDHPMSGTRTTGEGAA